MTIAQTGPAAIRPHVRYKNDLVAAIMDRTPASVLDIGCGEGQLIDTLQKRGIARCTGIEVDPETVRSATGAGLDVRLGRAEQLPFEDKAFDVVVLDYVAHHLEFLGCALSEAARVAKQAVLILDPWFDTALPSQQVARDFDNWFKHLDRRLGMVHFPVIDTATLATAFAGPERWQIDVGYRLVHQGISIDVMEGRARGRLAEAGCTDNLAHELAPLLDRARLHGVTEDGAVLFCADRSR
ncbi:MAG: class I SAM-dependent methyltransferase [Sphingopyxis sp.]|uniref:class I SAM-dependent methyltransferase n=1 Tax=Sphingopyxis sp. TaxID=1908224 RepID=UPI002ABCF4B7|nr:class I SAM-dependent methyltransferase [Sphingopyxis sp.]MDZ3830793.1 class I SAM-dependent methyltransferase [Sphingopyxis sp.]